MWSILLGLLPGVFKSIDGITNAISNERLATISAKTDEERIASQERVSALQARRDALIIAQSNPWTVRIQSFIALSAGIIIFKLLAWDKVMGSFMGCARTDAWHDVACNTFRTDPIDPTQWGVVTAVVGFYFLASVFKK